jgi:hypothetical protein
MKTLPPWSIKREEKKKFFPDQRDSHKKKEPTFSG